MNKFLIKYIISLKKYLKYYQNVSQIRTISFEKDRQFISIIIDINYNSFKKIIEIETMFLNRKPIKYSCSKYDVRNKLNQNLLETLDKLDCIMKIVATWKHYFGKKQ